MLFKYTTRYNNVANLDDGRPPKLRRQMNKPAVHIIGTRGYPSFYGGFETLVRQLAPFLADSGWDVTVFGRGRTQDAGLTSGDPRVRSLETRGIESKQFSTLSYGLTSSIRSATDKPDVALVMNVANGFWLPMLKARRVPTVVNVDGIEWERAKWGNSAKKLFKAGALATARFADELIYDSRELGSRWGNEFNRDGQFIPYGGYFGKSRPTVEGLDHRKYVLAVARFVPENTIDEFIDAATRLSENWDVVVVGSSGYGGPTEDRLRSLTKTNPRVKWLGHVSDDEILFALWEHAGAYFHGHSVGGTNPALVQAMALGAPTVARDTVFNREVLGKHGHFAEASAESIFVEISKMMRNADAQKASSSSGIERVNADYTWEKVCSRYDEVLRSIARRGGMSTKN